MSRRLVSLRVIKYSGIMHLIKKKINWYFKGIGLVQKLFLKNFLWEMKK